MANILCEMAITSFLFFVIPFSPPIVEQNEPSSRQVLSKGWDQDLFVSFSFTFNLNYIYLFISPSHPHDRHDSSRMIDLSN